MDYTRSRLQIKEPVFFEKTPQLPASSGTLMVINKHGDLYNSNVAIFPLGKQVAQYTQLKKTQKTQFLGVNGSNFFFIGKLNLFNFNLSLGPLFDFLGGVVTGSNWMPESFKLLFRKDLKKEESD